jgi:hypothetical protein
LKKKGMTPKAANELVDTLIAERTPGKPVLAPAEDPRAAAPPKVEQMFGKPKT